jgi:hypothetical protein
MCPIQIQICSGALPPDQPGVAATFAFKNAFSQRPKSAIELAALLSD